jgi:hypothetical protein
MTGLSPPALAALGYGHFQIQDEGLVEWLRQLGLEE